MITKLNHEAFKADYVCSHYHGDPSYGGAHGNRQTGTVAVVSYRPDGRTIMGDGRAMVVWAKLAGGHHHETPGFLNGYTRSDALEMARAAQP